MKELVVILAAIRSSYDCIIGGILLVASVALLIAKVKPKTKTSAIIMAVIGILGGLMLIAYGLALF